MKQNRLQPSGFFVLRSPLLPFDDLVDFSAGLQAPQATDPEQLVRALQADQRILADRLLEIFGRPEVKEALFIASPSLLDRVEVFRRDADSKRGRKVARGLVSYLARMASRPTPFGLFAGTSVGTIGRDPRIEFVPRRAYRRHSRLDMGFLCTLSQALQRDPTVRPRLRYFPNNSLYRLADRFHFAEWRMDDSTRLYHLVSAEAMDYLSATLARADQGATPGELAEALAAADREVSLQEALEYIDSLIDSQVLVSELEPRITGPEPVKDLIMRLSNIPTAQAPAETLSAVTSQLDSIDSAGIGVAPAGYQELFARLETLSIEVDRSNLLQVDLFKPLEHGNINATVVDEVQRAIHLLARLSGGEKDRLQEFAEAFRDRYGEREVALFEVLDEELGLGFEASHALGTDYAPLLKGLALREASAEPRVLWHHHHAHMLRRVSELTREGLLEWHLDSEDIKMLEADEPLPLPYALAALLRIASPSPDALAKGDFQVLLESVWGPSGAGLMGRFCHGDAELDRFVRHHLSLERAHQPHAAFAEIVHQPEGRIGNVLLRPLLSDFEIPFLGASGAPPERQIPITDLWVRVRDGRITLHSKRLQREIIPRLTSAHNFQTRSLGTYRFLCMLQAQGTANALRWQWGPLEGAPFLPRVVKGKAVLALARWTVYNNEIKDLAKLHGSRLYAHLQEWRARRRLPRRVVLSELDQELPLDLDNILCVETLVSLINRRPVAKLTELFPAADQMWMRGPEGHFAHQLLIPYVRDRTPLPPDETAPDSRSFERSIKVSADNTTTQRSFAPGSSWLSAKLYTGSATSDRVLTSLVRPLLERIRERALVDRWFFVRYADPGWHLRLRFHGRAADLRGQVLPHLRELADQWIGSGAVWRMQLDTYERELERYGGPEGIELVEQIFHADSEAVLDIVEHYPGDEGAEARWQLALRGIDTLLSDVGLGLEKKAELTNRLAMSLAREFWKGSAYRHELGTKFRRHRRAIEAVLHPGTDRAGRLAPGLEAIARRSRAIAPLAEALRQRRRRGLLTASLPAIVSSIAHMHVNRVLRSSQRAQEAILYFLLARHYDSVMARSGATDGEATKGHRERDGMFR